MVRRCWYRNEHRSVPRTRRNEGNNDLAAGQQSRAIAEIISFDLLFADRIKRRILLSFDLSLSLSPPPSLSLSLSLSFLFGLVQDHAPILPAEKNNCFKLI